MKGKGWTSTLSIVNTTKNRGRVNSDKEGERQERDDTQKKGKLRRENKG